MDVRSVRLPNGTVIQNVPVDTTQAQLIEQLRASGYDVSQFADAIPSERGGPFRALGMSEETERNLTAGAVRALMGLAKTTGMPGLPERSQLDRYMQERFNVDPESTAYGVGQLGAEITAGMPIVRGVGAAVGRVAPALGQAIKTGGFEVSTPGLGGIGLRLAGGGAAGVAGTAPFNPADALMGGVVGATLAPVARLALGGLRTARDLILTRPETIAENALLESGGETLRNALIRTQNMKVTPGYTPSVGERAVEGGVDSLELAALQNRLRRAPKAAQIQFDAINKNMGFLQGQLDRVSQELVQEGTQLAPADLTRLSEVRNTLQRQLAAEEQNLNSLMQSLRGRLPPQQVAAAGEAPGEIIQSRAQALQRQVRAQEVQPAYRAAFEAAGDTPIDVTPIADAARAALGRPLAEFAPESMPSVARVLARLEARPVVETRVSSRGRPQRVVTGETPPTMTLEELDALRKAINSDIASAQRSMAGLTPAQVPDLMALHRQIDDAIAGATNLSDEAKQLYGQALSVYRNRFAPAFKDNVTGRLLKDTAFGETRVLPENAVAAYFKNPEDTRQFFTTFGQDPQARAAFGQGIEAMFRDVVIDPATRRLDPNKAAKFLSDNAEKLQLMEQSGLPIGQRLQSIQTEAARITQGLDEVASLRGVYGQENAQDIVQSLLASSSQMSDALRRLTPDGREAIQASIVQRVTNMLTGDKPNVGAAVKLLADSSASIKQVMGKDGFADLESLVERAGQLQKVSASLVRSLPDARVVPKVQQLTGNFTREELTDLASVAADIARFQRAEGLAALGVAAPRPAAQRLASEAAEQTSPVAGYSTLNQELNLALRINQNLRQRVNDRAANELAVLMYQKPDAALDAINSALARKERRTMFSGAAGRGFAVTVPSAVTPFVNFSQD